MDARWARLLADPGPRDGNWVTLPENGWGALIAYVAGPTRARPHEVPIDARTTRDYEIRDGARVRVELPMTPADLSEIEWGVLDYLRAIGLPPAPAFWWEVLLPETMAVDEFMRRIHTAVEAQRGAPEGGVEAAQADAQVISSEVRLILGAGPQTG